MWSAMRSAGEAQRPVQTPLGTAQEPLGLVDRSDQILSIGAREAFGEVSDPPAVLIDVVGDGGQFGGGRVNGGGHDGTVPLGLRNAPGPGNVASVGFAA